MSECHRHQATPYLTLAVNWVLWLNVKCGDTSVMFTAFDNSVDIDGGRGVMGEESKSKSRRSAHDGQDKILPS